MKDDIQVSYLSAEWGGPFIWFRNDRGNLELVSVKSITDTLETVTDAIREYVAEVSA